MPRPSAICTATAPTPPAPPSTKSVSPAFAPRRRSARSDVSPATPAAAATAQSMDAGLRAQALSTAYSACVFGPWPNTSSPTDTPLTPSPTSSTTPAASRPRYPGPASGLPPAIAPLKIFQSIGLTPAARTVIRTVPGPACTSGGSAHPGTPGVPDSSYRSAHNPLHPPGGGVEAPGPDGVLRL